MRKNEMNAKKLLVSFLLIASVLFLATATVSAAPITVDGRSVDLTVTVDDLATDDVSVIAGEKVEVEVKLDATVDADADNYDIKKIKIRAELESESAEVTAVTPLFDVREGQDYVKRLVLTVPSDLDEEDANTEMTLRIKVGDSSWVEYPINVQRPSYDFAVKSVITSNTIIAGQSMPVEVVLKNAGYNNADDVYVTVSIPELNIEKSAYFGDIVTGEYEASDDSDDDDSNTASGKLNLEVPYTAKTGVYTLVVEVENDETTSTVAKEIAIENGVSDLAIRSGNDVVVLNPTNQLKVYTVKYDSNEVTVVVPAVSSKNVAVEVPAGDYNFDVAVYSGATLLSTVNFSGSNQENVVELTNPVFVLTVILSVVFLVLLVVLVVLITKKPQKTEEFGESYY